MFLKILQNSQENTCARISFFNKVAGVTSNFIKKETLAQVFSCEFWEISKNIFFTEHLWATASGYGQNIFSRITVLYLIAKVERKEKTFYLKYEIILFQNEKRSKMF